MQVNEGVDGDPDDNYTDKPMTGCGSAAEGAKYDCTKDVTRQWYGNAGRLSSTTNGVYGVYDANGRQNLALSWTTNF